VADAVTLPRVEKQNLIGFGDSIVAADMAHIYATIGEHQVGFCRAFLVGLAATCARAHDVRDRDGWRRQKSLNCELLHLICVPPGTPAWMVG
jgi:hypothetical protein